MSDLVKREVERPARPLNALRHGLTAKTVLVPGEDATVYDAFVALWLDELLPVGTLEEFLAHRVSAAAWRLLRVERLEGALAARPLEAVPELLEAAAEERGGADGGWALPSAHRYDGLAKLARHESAIERAFFRALSALEKVKAARLRAATKAGRARR